MKSFTTTAIAILLLIAGCDSKEADPREDLFNGVAFSETGNPFVPAVAVHENSERMGILTTGGNDQVTGAIYTNRSGKSFVVYVGENGLPERAYSEGYIILFDNYRGDEVDVAVIDPSGEITITREVHVDTSQLTNLAGKVSSQALLSLTETFRYAALVLSTAGCVTAIILSAGIATAAIAIPCGAAIVSIGAALLASDEPAVEISASAIGIGAAAIGCGLAEPFSCATLVAELGAAVVSEFEDEQVANQQTIAVAGGALQTGSGDVQVTLSWDTTNDIDLWVTDPFGERIYFAHPSSQSGGQLDRDDINGFGPENIFWPSGQAPRGQYLVQVDHFSGALTTNYTVLIQAFGRARSFTGSVRPNQTTTVTRFSDTELALVAKNETCYECASLRNIVTK